jgi:alkane 1-monooxygenase
MIYLIPYLQMALGAFGLYKGSFFVWNGFVMLFMILPIIEILFKKLKFNPSEHKSIWAQISILLTPFALTAILFVSLRQAQLTENRIELLGIILSTGTLLGAFGITSAHELIHRRETYLRAIGVYNLTLVHFAHWGLEHVFGHHKHVATPLDPATAREGELIYTYWLRSYFGVLRGAWKISKIKVSVYFFGTLILSLSLLFFVGPKVLVVWLLSSMVAILLLQTVDYIEHYALLRNKNQDGFYLAFKPQHSWDSSSLWTNVTLFNLGFHSHHHMKAHVPYEDLADQPLARQMPFGYSVMVPMALFPFIYIPYMKKQLNL